MTNNAATPLRNTDPRQPASLLIDRNIANLRLAKLDSRSKCFEPSSTIQAIRVAVLLISQQCSSTTAATKVLSKHHPDSCSIPVKRSSSDDITRVRSSSQHLGDFCSSATAVSVVRYIYRVEHCVCQQHAFRRPVLSMSTTATNF